MSHGPQKIILIRSGRYDYAEVELAGALQIVGPNNTGKTTLINTLQFLYVDDLRTMNFGSYSLEQTLGYYFPNQYSYVLFQCLGASGQCVVGWRGQSRASGASPERFCYLGPFNPEDFFDASNQVREPRDVSARLALKEFRIIHSAQDHRELLLPPAGPDGKGLGIVVLRDNDRFRRFRESLKDLLNLSAISQEQMRERLLTLADVRVDIPALDIRRLFGDDYDRIRQRRDALARFRKCEDAVRSLVHRSEKLARTRGELMSRWSDLRGRRVAFDTTHAARVGDLQTRIAGQVEAGLRLAAEIKDRQADRDNRMSQRGGFEARLAILAERARDFADFNPDFAEVSRQNLKREEARITRLLAEAETETRDKAQQKVALYRDLHQDKARAIENFDRLAITTLRREFSDDDLNRAFRILNFDLLETAVGDDGIVLKQPAGVLDLIRRMAGQVKGNHFDDPAVRITLREPRQSVEQLAHVDRLREELREHEATLRRWESILKAINDRERLIAELRERQAELETLQRRLVLYAEFVEARADEPRLRRDLDTVEQALASLGIQLAELDERRKTSDREREMLQRELVDEEKAYSAVLARFSECQFPDFQAASLPLAEVAEDFDAAITLYLKLQEAERHLREEVARALASVTQWVGEEFNGADEGETVRNLAAELEALPDKTEALERDWNALIQGLRGTFAGVLKELEAVRSVVTELNRQFARVQVSNLRSIKLEVIERADLVGWIRRLVDLQQPGLFDDDTQMDQALRNFRQKLDGSPLIAYTDLFELGLVVEGEDGVRHRYLDLKQIESHGTTIAIKVLFNLLVLRRYLKEGQCLVPFFLDEVQALDPANRHAILATAQKLGFIAITAAPESITEVNALYFLQPHQGRIVLRHRHKLAVHTPGAKA